MANYNILYVDDEMENLTSFKYLFKKNYKVMLANSALEGLQTLKEENIHIVNSIPVISGIL